MTLLSLEAISKGFGMKPLLEDITFALEHDERMGIIGPNGSGKSTLLRIIAGQETPDSGRVMLAGNPVVAYLSQDPTFAPELTVLDAVFDDSNDTLRLLHDYEAACLALERNEGDAEALMEEVSELAHRLDTVGGWDLEATAKAVLSRLGITDVAAKIGTLSGGQRKRVAMARLLILRPDLLILDEPTNHLDADTIAWMEGFLRSYTGALLLVTHDRYFLDRVTNRMLEIENGFSQRFEGNYTYYLEKKEEQAAQKEAEGQRRQNLVRRELAWLRRGAKARTTKQKARVDRTHALLDEEPEEKSRGIDLAAASARLGRKVVELDRVSKAYGDLVLLEDFTHSFQRGDRIGIIGPNGAGKTTLLEIIAGRRKQDSGNVDLGPTAVIGYYDQESRALKDDLRVIDYVKEVAETIRTPDGRFITASQMLDRFLFPPKVQFTPVGKLSGGERRRLYLLRILMGAPNVLLLDEPTNDLDIPTLVALEDYLDTFPGCLIVASHDRYFLDRTVEHLFQFEGDGRVRQYPGNYTAYLEVREREAADAARAAKTTPQPAAKPAPAPEPARGAAPTPPKLSFKEKRELAELETRIEQAEIRKAELEEAIAGQASDYEAVAALSGKLEELLARLDRDLERWAELAARAD
jgi:ABC transport system ATP-binding/permease protein